MAALALGACSRPHDARTGCNANDNPIDGALCPEFEAAGYQPLQASDTELCTRLAVDMLGARPTKAEIESTCAGRDEYDVVRSWQRTKTYRETQRRRWADRLQYSDELVDAGQIKALDGLVDLLYQERLNYPDFAVVALSHPAFVGRFGGYGMPDLIAQAAFKSFLGRVATAPEAADVGALWKPWVSQYGPEPGPEDNGVGAPATFAYGPVPFVDPTACDAGHDCSSSLLGPAAIHFHANGRTQMISASDLTPDDWEALRAPGRLFVSVPMFWEAEVDDSLKRYLGYDLGSLRPQVRENLVRWFRSTGGDVPRLERAVLTSWAYRQSAQVDAAHPRPDALLNLPLAYGPTKLLIPEAFLQSVAKVTGKPVGDCDWRYPNLPEWYYPGNAQLDAELGDDVRYPKLPDGRFDKSFRDTAAGMGGCPGTFDFGSVDGVLGARERVNQMGLMTAVAQDESLVQLCLVDAVPNLVHGPARIDHDSIRQTVKQVMTATLSRDPADDEVDEVTAAALQGCTTCDTEEVARDLCSGLAGDLDFIFY